MRQDFHRTALHRRGAYTRNSELVGSRFRPPCQDDRIARLQQKRFSFGCPLIAFAIVLAVSVMLPGCQAKPPAENAELTPKLIEAILASDEARAIELVRQGAPRKAVNSAGASMLHLAARANMADLTRLLLDWGADVNAEVHPQAKPIHWAVRTGAFEAIDVLLEYGADINASSGYTAPRPIDLARQYGNEEMQKFLLDRGAKLN
jgi:ankyrin repeat protein